MTALEDSQMERKKAKAQPLSNKENDRGFNAIYQNRPIFETTVLMFTW